MKKIKKIESSRQDPGSGEIKEDKKIDERRRRCIRENISGGEDGGCFL
jgi:hypothetical protein